MRMSAAIGMRAIALSTLRPRGSPLQMSSLTGGQAAGALASSAVILEAVQVAGTAAALAVAQHQLGTSNPFETVGSLVALLQDLGLAGYAVFSAIAVFFQIFPIVSAYLVMLTAGAIFGAAKGTATVLMCSTIGATLCFLIARTFARDVVIESAKESAQFLALDKALGEATFSKSVTLITLLRLSPVIPFVWGSYVFGLLPISIFTFAAGTFVGCLPYAVAASISSEQLGVEAAVHGEALNPYLLGLGAAATIGALGVAGNLATDALREAGLDVSTD